VILTHFNDRGGRRYPAKPAFFDHPLPDILESRADFIENELRNTQGSSSVALRAHVWLSGGNAPRILI
jgi:hypothetical protein